ncbi:hypothetical protein ACQ4PT_058578 [Festuca glaucescens]
METLTFLGMGDLPGVDRAPEATSSGATSPVLFGTISSIATIPGFVGTTSVAAATPSLFCTASSAASMLGRFSGATIGSVPAPMCVSSGTNSLPTATYKSTGWQPDYLGVTSDFPAPCVFDGMPTPSNGLGSKLSSLLQWNQSSSHTGQQHQMLNTSSGSDYETTAMAWSYSPTLQGRVLSVVMHQVKYPVPIDVLNHLFSAYGVVEKIFQSLNQHGRKLLIQYQHAYMADNALRGTNGWYLYCTYCQLDIRHADPAELQILDDYSCALLSEINSDADHLSHDVAAMPKDKVSDCSQLVTPDMKGHISEHQVQTSIPVFKVVTNDSHEQQLYEEGKPETKQTSKYSRKAPENKTHSPKYATATDQMQFQTSETLPVFDVYDDKMDGCSSEFVDVLVGIPDQ